VPAFEALAVVCRRLAEPSQWSASEVDIGRSFGLMSRILNHVICYLYAVYREKLHFDECLSASRISLYCESIKDKGAPLDSCWAFIDGTKH
jgi:hypothetical protein